MNSIKNQKGFALVLEIILVMAVAGVIAIVAYSVWHQRQTKTTPKSNASVQPTNTVTPDAAASKTTKKTMTYQSASFSFNMPTGWTYKEVPTVDDANEKLVYVINPANQLQLELQIQTNSVPSSYAAFSALQHSFTGINTKTYYLSGYKGNSTVPEAYELLSVTACANKQCHTKLNNEYDLNLAIRAADFDTPIKLTDPGIKDTQAIIKSIQITSL